VVAQVYIKQPTLKRETIQFLLFGEIQKAGFEATSFPLDSPPLEAV
jgi:hypothetical protein